MKHIGIVACSAEGASLCYLTICLEGQQVLGKYGHPEITMHTHPLKKYMKYIENGNWSGVSDLMLSSTHKLLKAGADFIICPDNTIHQAFDTVIHQSPLPWLHIAKIVAEIATKKRYKKIGVLGTRYLMEGPVYSQQLTVKKIEYAIPPFNARKKINDYILEELVNGIFSEKTREYFSTVISRLQNVGCDAVVLGCTEIPLLVTQQDSSLPILDSTRLLARAALKAAL